MSAELIPMFPEPAVNFSDFWVLYVRHEAKKDAMKAWSQLDLEDQTKAIIGAAAWRREYLRRERCYIPLPGTWLRGWRWEDELPSTNHQATSSAHVPFPEMGKTERSPIPKDVLDMIAKLKK